MGDCASSVFDGLIRMMMFLRMDQMADIVIEDLKAWGFLPVLAIVLVYRLLIEAVIYKKFMKPYFKG